MKLPKRIFPENFSKNIPSLLILRRRTGAIFYVLVFATWPILAVYFKNIREVFPGQLVAPIILSLLVFASMLFILHKVLKSIDAAAFITGTAALTFFFYMAAYNKIAPHLRGVDFLGVPIIKHQFIGVLIILGFMSMVVFFYRKKIKMRPIKLMLNTVAAVLLFSTLYNITIYEIGNRKSRNYSAAPNSNIAIDKNRLGKSLPDVYYFVFDRYASQETLKTTYNFENEDFLGFLQNKGFQTNNDAHANYPFTAQSLASSLNIQYLNDIGNELKDESSNLVPLLTMVKNNRVGQTFQKAGYQYVQMGSWWNGSRTSDIADVQFNKAVTLRTLKKDFVVSEFSTIVLQESLLQPFLVKGISLFGFNIAKFNNIDVHRKFLEYQFDKVSEVSKIKGPKFVFGHLLIPHPPYIYDRDGSLPPYPATETGGPPESVKYINQMVYANSKIKEMINTILTNSDKEPIIVLQADEGPYPVEYVNNGGTYDWVESSDSDLQQKLGILLSIYEPSSRRDSGFNGTPVNIFPYIFNKYLETDLEPLKDRIYVYKNTSSRYDFYEVTDRLKPESE